MTIRVVKPGLFTTIQDLGRYGYAHLGISSGGAADSLSFRIANRLVGNDDNTPALEMTLLGATLEFEETAIVAITGAHCECKVSTPLHGANGRGGDAGPAQLPANTACELPARTVLECGSMSRGARCYLAIQGGFETPLVMGSASTFVTGHFGGFQGRNLQKGDILRVRQQSSLRRRALRPGALEWLRAPQALRVTKGPQQEWFAPEAFEQLLSTAYVVSEHSDRRGVRLNGAALRPPTRSELLTEGVPLGAIQVPQDGQPIILLVDQQTTGGYPKIANVIAADLHRVGQLRPRDEVRFVEVSMPEAVQALAEQEHWLEDIFDS
ncbi:MAG TPA: biotin-dependent carboxyltransferase family protein [Terriglobales bacterium]|nr:biotin-dependent carboxyltransferase family protein [Terriglobales bacterium]